MTGEQAINYQAVIVPDELTGINIKHLYIEPPFEDQSSAEQIASRVGANLIDMDDGKGRSKFVVLGATLNNEVIIENLDKALGDYGHNAQPLEGLPRNPTSHQYAAFIAQRAWEAAR